jgi:hypothetical protein
VGATDAPSLLQEIKNQDWRTTFSPFYCTGDILIPSINMCYQNFQLNDSKKMDVEKRQHAQKPDTTSGSEKHIPNQHITGTVDLYLNGQQRLIPVPSSDPLGKYTPKSCTYGLIKL